MDIIKHDGFLIIFIAVIKKSLNICNTSCIMKRLLITLITSEFCEALSKGFEGIDQVFGGLILGFQDLGKGF